MQRRNFFKSLVGRSAAAVAVAGGASAKAPAQTILPHQLEVQGADYLRWKGVLRAGARLDVGLYKVVWTGWKSYPEVDRLCGQWLARPRASSPPVPKLFASYPGGVGAFYEGDAFQTGTLRGQRFLVSSDPDEDFEHAQRETYVLLRQVIEGYDWISYGEMHLPSHKRARILGRIYKQAEEFWQRFEVRNPHR